VLSLDKESNLVARTKEEGVKLQRRVMCVVYVTHPTLPIT
jgi:hypothetical protein